MALLLSLKTCGQDREKQIALPGVIGVEVPGLVARALDASMTANCRSML
jgi:hypothetical protein